MLVASIGSVVRATPAPAAPKGSAAAKKKRRKNKALDLTDAELRWMREQHTRDIVSVLEQLVRDGGESAATLAATDGEGRDALWWACRAELDEVALRLIAVRDIPLDAHSTVDGTTPLWWACRARRGEKVATAILDCAQQRANANGNGIATINLNAWQAQTKITVFAAARRDEAVAAVARNALVVRLFQMGARLYEQLHSRVPIDPLSGAPLQFVGAESLMGSPCHLSERGFVPLDVVGPPSAGIDAFENGALAFGAASASSSSSGHLRGSPSGSASASASAVGSNSGGGESGNVALALLALPLPSQLPSLLPSQFLSTAPERENSCEKSEIDWKRAWSLNGRRGGSVGYCIACRPKVDREEMCPICLTCWGEPVVAFDESHGGCATGALAVRITSQKDRFGRYMHSSWVERWYQPRIKGVFCGACRVCVGRKRVCGACAGCKKPPCGACAACTAQPARLPCVARICANPPICAEMSRKRGRLGSPPTVAPRRPPTPMKNDTVERARTEARSAALLAALRATLRSDSAAAAQAAPRPGSECSAESWWTRNDDLLDEDGVEDSEPVRPDAWIECAFCDRWMHSRCLGLSAAEHGALHDLSHPIYGGDASEHFMCAECVETRVVRVINELVSCDAPGYFFCPVTDAIAPGYSDLIAEPMCFEKVRQCAEDGKYTSAFHGAQRLRRDVALVALNAITFNGMDSGVGQLAATLLDDMDRLIGGWLPLTTLSDVERRARTLVLKAAEHKAQEARRRGEAQAEKLKERAAVTVKIGALVPPAGPHSFVAIMPRSLVLARATARALCATEVCLLCARTGNDDALVFCYDCGEAMHSFCIWPDRDAAFVARAKLLYRCGNCTSCVGCGVRERDDLLVSCDACDSCFHTCCVQPPMSAVPEGSWFCGACIDCETCEQPQPPRRWSAAAHHCRRCALTNAELCLVCAFPILPEEGVGECDVCAAKMHVRCDEAARSPFAVRACVECSVACGELNAIARDVQRVVGMHTTAEPAPQLRASTRKRHRSVLISFDAPFFCRHSFFISFVCSSMLVFSSRNVAQERDCERRDRRRTPPRLRRRRRCRRCVVRRCVVRRGAFARAEREFFYVPLHVTRIVLTI